MSVILKILSYLGLGLTIGPSVLLLVGSSLLDNYDYKLLATVGMILWFATAPFWINKPAA
jgi:hypothetical protein